MRGNGNGFAPLALALAVAGCATTTDDNDPAALPEAPTAAPTGPASAPTAARGDIEIEVPRDWLGFELGLRPGLLRPVDRIEKYVDPVEDRPPEIDVKQVEDVDDKPAQLRATGPDGTIYDVIVADSDFEILDREMERRGLTGASPDRGGQLGAAPPPGGVGTNGWSNGIDSRVKWPDGANDWPRDTIGKLSSGCTGTLFEGRLVLTAFHCFFDGFGNWQNLSFRAGQDGGSMPYGDVPHTWKYWSQNFIDNNCHKWKTAGYTSTCEKYDWAIVVLASTPKTPGGATPGYMGYWYNSSDSGVAGYTMFHRGYPGCSSVNAPAGCQSSTMWGQSFSCQIGSFFGSVNGWNRNFWHGCDMSPGHSGGPMYSWSPGSNGPYLLGTNIAEACKSTDCGSNQTPNVAFRIDKTLAQNMSYYRSVY